MTNLLSTNLLIAFTVSKYVCNDPFPTVPSSWSSMMKHSDPLLTQSSMGSMVQSLLMARQGQGKLIPWKVMSLYFWNLIFSLQCIYL